jgi:hypothetical protein
VQAFYLDVENRFRVQRIPESFVYVIAEIYFVFVLYIREGFQDAFIVFKLFKFFKHKRVFPVFPAYAVVKQSGKPRV